MDIPLLSDILIIFILSTLVLFICHRINIPTIVGFLLTGIIAGPHGLALITAINQVETLANIGIVLLLFTIGIEFSLRSLWGIRRGVLIGGYLQVVLTIVAVFFIVKTFGFSTGRSLFIGFLLSLSSTAIVLKIMQEMSEVNSPHGRVSLGILIFQDVIVVAMMLFTPLLAGMSDNLEKSFMFDMFRGIGIIVIVLVSSRWIIPKVLHQIAKTRDRELFLLCTVMICLAVAWLTSQIGLSLALGAFLAGLIISESEYSHHALSNIIPFKDIFSSLFFVSVGMLLDINYFFSHPYNIIFLTACVMFLKLIIAGSCSAVLGFPFRTNLLVGVSLCQVGEFSFILSKTGLEYGLLDSSIYQIFLSVSILSMSITPFLMKIAPRAAYLASHLPMPVWFKSGLYPVNEIREKINKKNHIIIIGFGVNGKNLRDAAKLENIPYIGIDTNPETVSLESSKGEPVFFGDATQESVLKLADIKDARVIVIAVSDIYATNLITRNARLLNPNIYIIVRTKYYQQAKIFKELGADEVVSEELETSIEILYRALKQFNITTEKISSFVDTLRVET